MALGIEGTLDRSLFLGTHSDDVAANARMAFMSNRVTSAKYSLLNFVPKNLWEQFQVCVGGDLPPCAMFILFFFIFFRYFSPCVTVDCRSSLCLAQRLSNIYFLGISVLTLMPFSPSDPTSMIGTFVFVLALSAAKDAVEDHRRHKADKEINTRLASVWDAVRQDWTPKMWADLVVGDLVRVERNHSAPVDLLLLASADSAGAAFIDTANLDGESNLKKRQYVGRLVDVRVLPSSVVVGCLFLLACSSRSESRMLCPLWVARTLNASVCCVGELTVPPPTIKFTNSLRVCTYRPPQHKRLHPGLTAVDGGRGQFNWIRAFGVAVCCATLLGSLASLSTRAMKRVCKRTRPCRHTNLATYSKP